MSKIKNVFTFIHTLISLFIRFFQGESILLFAVNTVHADEEQAYSVWYNFRLKEDLNLLHMPDLLSCIMEQEAAMVTAEEMKDLVEETA
jgi:hypothetical protein